jgi:hypothetical protein
MKIETDKAHTSLAYAMERRLARRSPFCGEQRLEELAGVAPGEAGDPESTREWLLRGQATPICRGPEYNFPEARYILEHASAGIETRVAIGALLLFSASLVLKC